MSPSSNYPICSPPQRVFISYRAVNTVSVTNIYHLMMLIETIAVWPFTEWLDDRSEDIHRGAYNSLARPTSPCILFDSENISFDASLALYTYIYIYTGCNRRNGPNFGRVFLMLNYTDITQNTYVQS